MSLFYRHIPLPCIAPISVHDEGDMLRNGTSSKDSNDSPPKGRRHRIIGGVQEVDHVVKEVEKPGMAVSHCIFSVANFSITSTS